MIDDILNTKLHMPPQRPLSVPRPHLWRQLDEGRRRKWTLVSAPAGFGKTILLSSWAAQSDLPVAWVSLEESDDEPRRFWRYLFAALDRIGVPLAAGTLVSLGSPEPLSIQSLLTNLLNSIAALEQRFVLILDDYHHIESADIHREMVFLLDHLPRQLHCCLATRSDPPYPLSRYRAGNELVELRTSDLRFQAAETALFLNQSMHLNLSRPLVQALAARTEGWIAGLQMAALSLQKQPGDQVDAFVAAFSGSHHYILDYLRDQVLKEQPDIIRQFLLDTAVLDRLCGPLCDAVRELPGSQQFLEELEAGNLFLISLDDKRQWYRYHHLFADLLRQRLRHSRPEDIPRLHLRASRWYEAAGLANKAISHAIAADDETWLADLIEKHILQAVFRSEFVIAGQWIKALPAAKIQASPILCLAQAWLSLRSTTVAEAEQLVASLPAAQPAIPTPISGHLQILRTILSRKRGESPQRQIELAERALVVIPQTESGLRSMVAFRIALGYLDLGAEDKVAMYCRQAVVLGRQSGSVYAVCGAHYVQALMTQRRGMLRETVAYCRQALDSLTETDRQLPMAGVLNILMGNILAEWRDVAAAERSLHHGLTLTASGGFNEAQIMGAYALARLRLGRDQEHALPDLVSLTDSSSLNLIAYAAALQARLHLIAAAKTGAPHHLHTAVRWAATQTFQVETGPDADWRILAHLVHARVNLAQHRAGQPVDLPLALDSVQQLLPFIRERGWRHIWLEALLVEALLLQAAAREKDAQTSLAQALSLAEPEKYRGIFLDEGQSLAHLLYRTAAAERASDYARDLLAAFAAETAPPAAHTDLIEPLTAREVEVLHLLADGLTNREIGRQLSISLGTVKRHTANINGKLNAHNRTQAVARARALGILSD